MSETSKLTEERAWKKYAFPVLFVLVLGLPAVVSRLVKTEAAPVAAKDALRLDIISPNNQDIRNAFSGAFSKWHEVKYGRPVELRFVNVGGTGDITRLLRSNYEKAFEGGALKAGFVPPYDIVWGGGDAFFDRDIKTFLKGVALPAGVLEGAIPKPVLNGVRLYDWHSGGGETKWVGYCISSFGIVYNPDVYTRLKLPLPEAWHDLAREELSGWVALANPLSSSSAATAYSMNYQRTMADAEAAYLAGHPELSRKTTRERMKDAGYLAAVATGWKKGMGELLLVSANARYITDSGSQPPNDVANGDAAAAMAIDFYGRANEFAMGEKRFKLMFPRGAAAMNPDPVGVLAGVTGEREATANHFIEYLLTMDGQRLWQLAPGQPGGPQRPLFRSPIRRDAYADRAGWTNPGVNPFEDESGFFKRDEWESLFAEVKLVWAVSWIDARDELKSAHTAIRHVADESRRKELFAQLADFPLTYGDVAKLQADIKAKPTGEVQAFRAQERIRLANLFRGHYRKIEAAAK